MNNFSVNNVNIIIGYIKKLKNLKYSVTVEILKQT